ADELERIAERHTEAVLVGGGSDRGTGLDLRRHEAGRAGDTPKLTRRPRRIVGFAGEAEVHDADAPIGTDDRVLGLEVAMDQTGVMRGSERAPSLLVDLQDLAQL